MKFFPRFCPCSFMGFPDAKPFSPADAELDRLRMRLMEAGAEIERLTKENAELRQHREEILAELRRTQGPYHH